MKGVQRLGVKANIHELTTPAGPVLGEINLWGEFVPLDHEFTDSEAMFRVKKLNSEELE